MNVTFKLAGGNVAGDTGPIVKTGKYGTALTAPAPVQTGFVFKGWSPAPPSPLAFPAINTEYTAQWAPVYAITFSVDGAGGTLKATVEDGSEITSGKTVEHGKTVTFTATPAAGYRIKEWKLGEEVIAEAGTNTEYTLTVTKPAAVTVSFEPKKALLTLEAGKNTVKVKAKTADGKPITVEGCTVTELANDTETTLTVTSPERKLALIGDIIELNCRGDNNVGGNRPLIALDVSGLTALQKLDCAKNQLTALNVQGLTELQELYCNTNQIPELNVHGLTKLQKLNCQGNELTTLNVQGLTELQKLNCQGNQLSTLDVQGLTKLQQLECYGNQLTTLNVSDCTALKELICHSNELSTLDVSGLTALQELYCNGSNYHRYLSELNVQGCTSLKTLRCHCNKLNADAFIKIFNDLPTREVSDGAKAVLYKDRIEYEDNCTDFTQPESLKKAFENARDVKHWKMQKLDGYLEEDI